MLLAAIDVYTTLRADRYLRHNGGLIIESTMGIPDESRPENVQALTDAAHEYGVY